MIRTRRALFPARSLSSTSSLLSLNRFFRGVLPLQPQSVSIFATDDNYVVTQCSRDIYLRPMSKMTRILHSQDERQQQEIRTTIHQQYYPDSFVYRRGDHPYGTREYLLVRPKPKSTDDYDDDGNNNNGEIIKSKLQEKDRNIIRIPQYINQNTKSSNRTMMESNLVSTNQELQILATLHANNNIVFGANINHNVIHHTNKTTSTKATPTILDLCPILLNTALMDCSNEGEQPQALATLHGLSAWVRQCLFNLNNTTSTSIQPQPQSHVLQALQQQMQSSTSTTLLTTLQSETLEHLPPPSSQQALSLPEQLECITAMATNVPRPGHSVVGQKTFAGGAAIWEALAREYALLENDTRNTTDDASSSSTTAKSTTSFPLLSEECLLYRHNTESCELVEIELLADTSPSYLLSAGGAMARFFIM